MRFAMLCSMRPLKSLSLESIVGKLSATFSSIADSRDTKRVDYSLHDTIMSGFACMFFQHPSLLEFQRSMQTRRGISNLHTIFGVKQVPSDTTMREVLDPTSPEPLRALLPELFEGVRRAGWAKDFRVNIPTGSDKGNYYYVPMDATEYFHSTRIECSSCLKRTYDNGQTHYSHYVVAATLVKPGSHKILPMDVEQVSNEDGQDKQDCEVEGGKRLAKRLRKEHPQLEMIIGGDDLYSHEPYVELLKSNRLHYVLVAKPSSHKELFEWVEEIDKMGEAIKGSWQTGPVCKRRYYNYRIVKQVPLTKSRGVYVNFVEVWETNKEGKLLYHNSWITDLDVEEGNVSVIVEIGRSRWKIENEHFNVHKNHGYELEHNFGHGKQNLSTIFYLLNLLGFVAHKIIEMGDRLYQQCREKQSRRELWNNLRTMMNKIMFESWKAMMEFWLDDEIPDS